MYYFYFFVCNIYLYEVGIFSIEKITRNALIENLIPFGYHFPASANIAHPPSYVSLKYLHFKLDIEIIFNLTCYQPNVVCFTANLGKLFSI